jgi:hypothetical protein
MRRTYVPTFQWRLGPIVSVRLLPLTCCSLLGLSLGALVPGVVQLLPSLVPVPMPLITFGMSGHDYLQNTHGTRRSIYA